jgi:uncharacterized protein (TIGR02145 family)
MTANGFCQGEQLYSDGTDTDQDGNTFEWINYGTRDWSIENADVSTYRDGTLIPQVTDAYEWENLTTGAWCYFYNNLSNNPNQPKLYNWYAVNGVHDNDPNTPNKEFAPNGWQVSSTYNWNSLIDYLVDNGYAYDTPSGLEDFTADSMAAPDCLGPDIPNNESFGWYYSNTPGTPGNNCSNTNNKSGFNAMPSGMRRYNAHSSNTSTYSGFIGKHYHAYFWTSSAGSTGRAFWRRLSHDYSSTLFGGSGYMFYVENGYSVRFSRTAQTANINNNAINDFKIIPNPTSDYLLIENLDTKNAIIYNIHGKEVMKVNNKNKIDVSSLSKGVYFVRVYDGINSSIKKFIKK